MAALHTKILEDTELHPFYELYPEKFSNKTNGITFRRWIMDANPALSGVLDDVLGTGWRTSCDLSGLLAFKDDEAVLARLDDAKSEAKAGMREFLWETQGARIPEDAIIDVQVKRIHEYKRQQMLALYIIWKYLDIKNGNVPARPLAIVFGGKAAPAYTIAQDIIHLILLLSRWIAADPVVSPHLQVVMIENYNVSAAERVIPAADISEQISLASKEASGTSNMKFMLNGAVTLCTLDGANVEIADLVGDENIYTFGTPSKEVRLHDDMAWKDWFMALLDIEEYIQKKEQVLADYENRDAWRKKSLVNIAKSGAFSSDRTIRQYNDDIWHL